MVSKREIERRRDLLRQGARQAGYDALILAGSSDGRGRGYVRYATDWRLFGGTGFVVLPLEADPVFVLSFGAQGEWAKATTGIADTRGVLNQVPEVVQALEQLGLAHGALGVAGLNSIMRHRDATLLTELLPNAQIKDATQLVEGFMVILSDEEIAAAEETHSMMVRLLNRMGESLAPGRTEREVMGEVIGLAATLGCLDGMAHLSPEAGSGTRPATDRLIQKDDIIKTFIEFWAPNGFAVELGGVFSFQEPSEFHRRKFDTVVKAVDRAASLMLPGAIAGDVCAAIHEVYVEDGWKVTGRRVVDFHGQGLNGHFAPDGLPESREEFRENMMINIHPGLVTEDGWGVSVTHNYIITPTGGKALGGYRPQWHVLSA